MEGLHALARDPFQPHQFFGNAHASTALAEPHAQPGRLQCSQISFARSHPFQKLSRTDAFATAAHGFRAAFIPETG